MADLLHVNLEGWAPTLEWMVPQLELKSASSETLSRKSASKKNQMGARYDAKSQHLDLAQV